MSRRFLGTAERRASDSRDGRRSAGSSAWGGCIPQCDLPWKLVGSGMPHKHFTERTKSIKQDNARATTLRQKKDAPVPSAKRTTTYIDEITAQWRRERPDLDLDKLLLAIYLQLLGMLTHGDFE